MMRTALLSLVVLPALACGPSHSVEGVAQKGPFQLGSRVKIQELSGDVAPSGRSYELDVADDLGSFALGTPVQSNLVEVSVTGFAYAETLKKVLTAPTSLLATVDLSAVPQANGVRRVAVNVLTHLQRPRLAQLIREGSSFADAEAASRDEVLAAFGHPPGTVQRAFSELRLEEAGDDNAILMAATFLVLTEAQTGTLEAHRDEDVPVRLSALLAELSTDLADGSLTGGVNRFQAAAGRLATLHQVMASTGRGGCASSLCDPGFFLGEYLAGKGVAFTEPNWTRFVDFDGNGVVDAYQ